MNDNGPHARNIRNSERTRKGVFQQAQAKSPPLPIRVDGKARNYDYRHGVTRKPLPQAFWRKFEFDVANDKREVPHDNPVIREADIALGCLSSLILEGMTLQIDIERLHAAIKSVYAMQSRQLLKMEARHFFCDSSTTLGSVMSLRRAGMSRGGASSAA